MERPAIPAVYDSNRDNRGHFVKGNSASKNHGNEVSIRFRDLRNAWYDATTPKDMLEVQAELRNLCLSCPVPDVKLKAIIYYLDRCLGKPVERLDVDVSSGERPAPLLYLSPEKLALLEEIVQETNPPEVFVVKNQGES